MNRYIHDQCGDLNVCSDGDYVLYTDHLAAIKELVSLCLSNGIISRGLACQYLGCGREELDEILDKVATKEKGGNEP